MPKPFDILVPIKVGNDKTIWQKIGVIFKNDDIDKKHLMSISIQAIPLKAFTNGEINAYVFPPRENNEKSP